MSKHFVKLNTGALMPSVGLGTWQAPKGEVGRAVEFALRHGVRHIDCAAVYGNETEIGETFQKVFSEGKIKREDVFIVSKLWNSEWAAPRAALEKTLKDLQLSYLDLYLVHSPVPFEHTGKTMFPTDERTGGMKIDYKTSLRDVWTELEKLHHEGLAKAIGVSNFPVITLRDMMCWAKVVPAINQIEIHPYLAQEGLIQFGKQFGIEVTAYSPLAHGVDGPLHDKLVTDIAAKYKVTPAQVLIRWCVDKGYTVIPKSVKEERIKENFDVFNFELTSEEVKQLTALNRNMRTCDLGKFWRNFPFYE